MNMNYNFSYEKTSWGTNSTVCKAFANRDDKNMRGKNIMYFAEDKEIYSYGLKIGVWDCEKNTPIVLECGCSSVTTNQHISDLHSATNYSAKVVRLQRGFGGYGCFPSEVYHYSVLSPNIGCRKFSDINLYSTKIKLFKSADGGYGYSFFSIIKVDGMWEFKLFDNTYRVKTLNVFRKICAYYEKIFTTNDIGVSEYLSNMYGHEHYKMTDDFHNDFMMWLTPYQYFYVSKSSEEK